MNLKHLKNEELNQSLKSLVHQERETLSSILRHIAEVDRRRLYLEMAYPNLFTYLTEYLGYSAGSAQRRLDAARLIREAPSLPEKLQSGELNLAQISLLQKAIRQKKKESHLTLTQESKSQLLDSLCGQSLEHSAQILARGLDLEMKTAPQIQVQKDASVRFEITLSQTQWQKMQTARELLSHSLPSGSWDEMLESLCDRLIEQKLKGKQAKGKDKMKSQSQRKDPRESCEQSQDQSHRAELPNSQSSGKDSEQSQSQSYGTEFGNGQNCGKDDRQSPLKVEPPASRVRASVKKMILRRDQCCQWRNPRSGKKCASKWQLQVDHLQPKWAAGSHHPDNLQILCGPHNRLKYQKEAGLQRVP
jgi:hypothetical protein